MVETDKFNYVYSCDLDINVQLKIGSLEGKREQKSYKALLEDPMLRFSGLYQETCSDLYVTCQVFAEGKPLALPVRTSYKAFSTRWNWNEWLKLPVKYPDLPQNAQVALTVWDVYGPGRAVPVGGTTVTLFGKYGMFRQGMHDLKVWPAVEGDGSEPTQTPGRTSSSLSEDQMGRLAKLTKAHRQGHMVKVDWLDRLTFREIEMINESEKRSSNFMYLMVEFPRVKSADKEFGIVYYEKDGDESSPILTSSDIVKVPDPQMSMENLVESKHHKLARSLRSGPSDHDLKPNAATRDQLNIIVSYPPTKQLTSEEQDLVWKFRYYLTTQEKALTKFLKCVNWALPQEAKQALELLGKWKPMDVEDSLELLSSQFSNPTVRRYAVARLEQADDEDLLMYLLQLVQALKYENFNDIKNGLEPWSKRDSQGGMAESVASNLADTESSQILSSPPPSAPPSGPAPKGKDSADSDSLEVQDKFRLDLSDEEAVHYMQSLIDESVGALFAAVVEQIHKFAQVQDKFRLDLSDEEAVHYMQSLIDESVGALFAAVVEQIHKFAQLPTLRVPPAWCAVLCRETLGAATDLTQGLGEGDR
ncbi:Phosphatidylinositol 3-kinase catalytic subunit type 3 [Acipenser ruthenus]|uniref:Phosphatidylinositol 3-kinase catalytic subunit type 3 n=1 Tax=Acipenser ruthenus TaxID=7906 RepID=A0A444U3A3_ACIRT|nr:Phosphatidylinositol 3-kinase catalytic subunit type 3 [Acipenser ruthenus]